MQRAPTSEPVPVVDPKCTTDQRARFEYREKLTDEELAAMRRELPADVVEAHLRWLETGEGDPWGESTK